MRDKKDFLSIAIRDTFCKCGNSDIIRDFNGMRFRLLISRWYLWYVRAKDRGSMLIFFFFF